MRIKSGGPEGDSPPVNLNGMAVWENKKPGHGINMWKSVYGFFRFTMNSMVSILIDSSAAAASSGGGRVPKLASPETSSIGSSVHSCVGGGGGLKPKPTGPPPPLQVAPPTAALAAVNISSAPSGQSRYHAHKPEQPKRGCTQVVIRSPTRLC